MSIPEWPGKPIRTTISSDLLNLQNGHAARLFSSENTADPALFPDQQEDSPAAPSAIQNLNQSDNPEQPFAERNDSASEQCKASISGADLQANDSGTLLSRTFIDFAKDSSIDTVVEASKDPNLKAISSIRRVNSLDGEGLLTTAEVPRSGSSLHRHESRASGNLGMVSIKPDVETPLNETVDSNLNPQEDGDSIKYSFLEDKKMSSSHLIQEKEGIHGLNNLSMMKVELLGIPAPSKTYSLKVEDVSRPSAPDDLRLPRTVSDHYHAKGDFHPNELPVWDVSDLTEIPETRKKLYKGFTTTEKIDASQITAIELSPEAVPAMMSTAIDIERNRARILSPSSPRQRSALLSISSMTIPPLQDEQHSAEHELLDQIFPTGARKLLAKLNNPADLEGLASVLERLERQERLRSALHLLEMQEKHKGKSQGHPGTASSRLHMPTTSRHHLARMPKVLMRRRQVWLQPSYHLPDNRPPDLTRARRVMQCALQSALEGAVYSHRWAPDVCRVLAAFITQEIKALNLPRYKISCVVRLIEKQHQQLCTSMAVLWDESNDCFCHAQYEQLTFLAHATVFVVHVV